MQTLRRPLEWLSKPARAIQTQSPACSPWESCPWDDGDDLQVCSWWKTIAFWDAKLASQPSVLKRGQSLKIKCKIYIYRFPSFFSSFSYMHVMSYNYVKTMQLFCQSFVELALACSHTVLEHALCMLEPPLLSQANWQPWWARWCCSSHRLDPTSHPSLQPHSRDGDMDCVPMLSCEPYVLYWLSFWSVWTAYELHACSSS